MNKPRGRPPGTGLPPEQRRSQVIQIRATAEEVEQFKQLGIERFRRWLQTAYTRLVKEGDPPA